MSLALTTSQTVAVGNGAQTAFPTGFSFESNTDLVVEVAPSGGAYVPKVYGVDYTVSGAGAAEPGGTVTFLAAPANLSNVRITRITPRTQPTSFVSQADFLPEVHEASFDHAERQLQEHERRLSAVESGTATVTLAASKVTDGPYTCPDAQTPRNVACAGTPSMVLIGRIVDNTDGTLQQAGLGSPDISAVALNQFTVRYVPGLTPGHSYTITYLVLTL